MQALRCDVATVCMGFAASMAQFLLVGGAPGQRAAHAHSRILMHQPHGAVAGLRRRHRDPGRAVLASRAS